MDKKIVFRLNDNGIGPELLQHVFLERGWAEYDPEVHGDDGWNIWWKTSRFRTSEYTSLMPWQWINHYPNCTSITKKDCLCRNLRKMRIVHGYNVFNFSPVAYNLPNDYTKFVSEYSSLRQTKEKQTVRKMWICKPAESSRGRGIFIFKELSELQYDCNAVVQEYIKDPLLIGGYKFDLRVYVAVSSFHPLQIYVHEEGLVRFGTEKYDLDRPDNVFAHLTNTSINKFSPGYTADKDQVGHGCKWTISQLRRYFAQNNVSDTVLWQRVTNIIILTMLMQAPSAPRVSNCFELYGFDILIDGNLKPWLLEVNFSPSLSSDCHADVISKKAMLHDLLDLVSCSESGLSQIPDVHHTTRPGRRGHIASHSESGMYSRRESQVSSGSSYLSSNSEKSLIHRRGRKQSFGQNRPLPARHAPINRYRTGKPSEILPVRRLGQEFATSTESLTSLQRQDIPPMFRDRLHSQGCRQERSYTPSQREENTGSLTVRTDACVLQVDSKTSMVSDSGMSSLTSLVDGNNNVSGLDGNALCLALSKNDSHQALNLGSHSSSRGRYDTPIPAPHDTSKQAQVFGDQFAPFRDSPLQARLQNGTSPVSIAENGLGHHYSASKKISLRSISPLLKRPVHSSPDCKRSPMDDIHGMNNSHLLSAQGKLPQSDKHSSTRVFRSSLQRSREMREKQQMPTIHPGKNGKPLLSRIARKKFGNFYLVFPFNEHTQQIAQGKLEAKQIIKEILKQQKEADSGQRDAFASSSDHWGLKIWAPTRSGADE